MMDRRSFLTRLGVLTAAAAVMDPAELIERLAPRKLYVPGAEFIRASPFGPRVTVTSVAELNALMKQVYGKSMMEDLVRESDLLYSGRVHRRFAL